MPVYVRDVEPAAAPAAMVKSGSGASTPFSLQVTPMVTSPCCPAAGPAMVLVTVSEPGTRSYL